MLSNEVPLDQLYVIGAEPPVTTRVAEPVEEPLHNTSTDDPIAILNGTVGSVNCTDVIVEHPPASVSVTV